MQRLYSMFPGSLAGVGLLILRMAVIGSILECAYAQRHFFGSVGWAEVAIGAVVLLIGIGILTPVTCGVGVIIELLYAFHSHSAGAWHVIPALLATLSLCLLGPGAFSLDARFFGRRRVIVRAPD
jgi:uncharacterized membrane protein YphA (DoxX/SURF4 family)